MVAAVWTWPWEYLVLFFVGGFAIGWMFGTRS